VPGVTELQQQSLNSNASHHITHPHISAALTDPIFPGGTAVGLRVYVPFMILSILPPALKQVQEGQLWSPQAPFKEQHQGSLETIHFLSCCRRHPQPATLTARLFR
jgi:hypothetical protein